MLRNDLLVPLGLSRPFSGGSFVMNDVWSRLRKLSLGHGQMAEQPTSPLRGKPLFLESTLTATELPRQDGMDTWILRCNIACSSRQEPSATAGRK